MKSRALWIALAAHVAVMLLVMPATPWEFDELLFYPGLHQYDPLAHHPPPPGYPVFILFGGFVRNLIPSDFATILVINLVASAIGFVLFALAFASLSGDEKTGVIGALLFYTSPVMLIHSTLPVSDPGALALLAAALYFSGAPTPSPAAGAAEGGGAPLRPLWLAVFASLTVGWRPQFAIFVVPFFLVALAFVKSWKDRFIALGVFTFVCLLWLEPLARATGGVQQLIDFETKQGQYLASHDADQSRTGWTPARIAFRFIGRPWGSEVMALATLALAGIGAWTLRKRWLALLPLIAGAGVYIAAALAWMDPADGVRYALPFVLGTALLAAAGLVRVAHRYAYVAAALASLVYFAYAAPLLLQRRREASPPVAAANYARTAMPKNAVALYELPLWPHAKYYLGAFNPQRVDDGLAKFWNRPDVPLFIYADGASLQPGAKVFQWKPSDVYTKLTRNHYRASSIVPLPPERRYRIISGVYAPERVQEGAEWRWLDQRAELQLPDGPRRKFSIGLRLQPSAPIERNTVTLLVSGRLVGSEIIQRGKTYNINIDIGAGAPVIRIESERAFIPAEIPSMRSGDRRRLAVELTDLISSPAPEAVH